MSMVLLIIAAVSGASSFILILLNLRKPTKTGQRISYVIAGILFLAAITSGVLSYWDSIENEDQLQLTREQAFEASVQANRAQTQITEFRTPRRMEPEIERMLAARLKPYAGQKYDMKVFRDQDSLELATAIQAILEEAGWVYTNVYPRYKTAYAETREEGVWLESGKMETIKTSEARTALRGALNEAGLYDDSTLLTPISCVQTTEPIQKGSKFTPIPCSESPGQITDIGLTIHDDVIPEDTLVLHIGKKRL